VIGKTMYSECFKNTICNNDKGIAIDEHMFFEGKNLDTDTLESANLTIKLLHKGLFRDKVCAEFDVDVAKIFGMNDKHVMEHQWVAMINLSSDNPNEIKAYLKVSV